MGLGMKERRASGDDPQARLKGPDPSHVGKFAFEQPCTRGGIPGPGIADGQGRRSWRAGKPKARQTRHCQACILKPAPGVQTVHDHRPLARMGAAPPRSAGAQTSAKNREAKTATFRILILGKISMPVSKQRCPLRTSSAFKGVSGGRQKNRPCRRIPATSPEGCAAALPL
jgi:hypothetical protein